MDVEKQVLVIWSATNGYTDDVAVEDIRRFESSLLKFVENSRPGLLSDIREQKAITEDIKAGLKQVLEDFKIEWQKESSTPTELPTASIRPSSSAAASTT